MLACQAHDLAPGGWRGGAFRSSPAGDPHCSSRSEPAASLQSRRARAGRLRESAKLAAMLKKVPNLADRPRQAPDHRLRYHACEAVSMSGTTDGAGREYDAIVIGGGPGGAV